MLMRVWKFIKREKRQPDAIKPAGWYLAWQTTCTSTDKWKNSLILHKIYKTVQINYHTISDPVAEDLCELRVYYNQTRGDSGKVVLVSFFYFAYIKFESSVVLMTILCSCCSTQCTMKNTASSLPFMLQGRAVHSQPVLITHLWLVFYISCYA